MSDPTLLQEGDTFLVKLYDTVYTMLPKALVYQNCEGQWDELARGTVHIGRETRFQSAYLLGEYVVTKTCRDGGGTGHGPGDAYPDGYHVWAVKIDNPKVKIEFYQSGCFSATIKDPPKTGKAELVWQVHKQKEN